MECSTSQHLRPLQCLYHTSSFFLYVTQNSGVCLLIFLWSEIPGIEEGIEEVPEGWVGKGGVGRCQGFLGGLYGTLKCQDQWYFVVKTFLLLLLLFLDNITVVFQPTQNKILPSSVKENIHSNKISTVLFGIKLCQVSCPCSNWLVSLNPREVPWVLNMFPRELIDGPPQYFPHSNP